MDHTKTQKLLRPIKYFGGRLFSTINATIQYCCQGEKKKVDAFSWAKNTARGERFLLGFNMYLFLA